MTAPAASWVWESTQSNSATAPDTLANLGFAVGDLLVVVQNGTTLGNGYGRPSGVTMDGSTTAFPRGTNNSAIALANSGVSGRGRAQMFARKVQSGDLNNTLTVDVSGFSTHRFSMWRLTHNVGWGDTPDDYVWFALGSGTPPNQNVLGFVDGTTMNHNLSAFGLSNTGATTALLADSTYPALVITALGASTSAAAATVTYDGVTSGIKFQRSPYVNSSGGGTTTTGAHGSHYSSQTVAAQTDYQEYDASDTLTSVLWNQDMNNSTHALLVVTFLTANRALKAKSSFASGATVTFPSTKINPARSPFAAKAKGQLRGAKTFIGFSQSSAVYDAGGARLNTTLQTHAAARGYGVANAYGYSEQVTLAAPDLHVIVPDEIPSGFPTRIWVELVDQNGTNALLGAPPTIAVTHLDASGARTEVSSGTMTQGSAAYYYDWTPSTHGVYTIRAVGSLFGTTLMAVGETSVHGRPYLGLIE